MTHAPTRSWAKKNRGIINQSMTFYKILNNIINITHHQDKNGAHYIVTACRRRTNTAVNS